MTTRLAILTIIFFISVTAFSQKPEQQGLFVKFKFLGISPGFTLDDTGTGTSQGYADFPATKMSTGYVWGFYIGASIKPWWTVYVGGDGGENSPQENYDGGGLTYFGIGNRFNLRRPAWKVIPYASIEFGSRSVDMSSSRSGGGNVIFITDEFSTSDAGFSFGAGLQVKWMDFSYVYTKLSFEEDYTIFKPVVTHRIAMAASIWFPLRKR